MTGFSAANLGSALARPGRLPPVNAAGRATAMCLKPKSIELENILGAVGQVWRSTGRLGWIFPFVASVGFRLLQH